MDVCLDGNYSYHNLHDYITEALKNKSGQRYKITFLYGRELFNYRMYDILQQFLNDASKVCRYHRKLDNTFELITNHSFKVYLLNYEVPPTCEYKIIDNFRLVAYLSQKFNLTSQHPPLESTNNNNKFLCKFGKINKPHRYLLYALMREHELFHDNLGMWSLVADNDLSDSLEDAIWKQLPRSISTPYPYFNIKKISEHDRILPDITPKDIEIQDGTFHYTGYPFDIEFYKNTKFSIVSESSYSTNIRFPEHKVSDMMMTEKFWIPTSVKHPVLLSAPPEQADVLRELGFKSIDKFKFCKASELDDYNEIKALFHECYSKFINAPAERLYEIADHNYNLFQKLGLQDYNKVASNEPSEFIKNATSVVPIAFSKRSFTECILEYQYGNRGPNPYDWDWDALHSFNPDK